MLPRQWYWMASFKVHHHTEDNKGNPISLDISGINPDLASLPLIHHPYGQQLTAGTRGLCSVEATVFSDNRLRLRYDLDGLFPHIVPRSYRNRLTCYTLQPTIFLPIDMKKTSTLPCIEVDTSFLARCHTYVPDDKKEFNPETMDPLLLDYYTSDQELEKNVPKIDSVTDTLTNQPIENVKLLYEEDKEQKGPAVFKSIVCKGSYCDPSCKTAPDVYVYFHIVPIRQEIEYMNYFNISAERTIFLHSIDVIYQASEWPSFVRSWLVSPQTACPIAVTEEVISKLCGEHMALNLQAEDESRRTRIPLRVSQLRDWAKHNINLVYQHIHKVPIDKEKDKQKYMDIYVRIGQVVTANWRHMSELHQERYETDFTEDEEEEKKTTDSKKKSGS